MVMSHCRATFIAVGRGYGHIVVIVVITKISPVNLGDLADCDS